MKPLRRLVAELEKIAITFEEYKNLHPRTRKTPNDPMFTSAPKRPRPQRTAPKPSVPEAPQAPQAPTQAPKMEESRQIKKPTSQMTDDELIDKYKPKTTGGAYQKKMTAKQIESLATKMSSDDLAWHLSNSKVNADEGVFAKAVGDKIGRFNAYMMMLYNPNISKSERTATASYIMDKAGVSFVGGRTLNRFMAAMARKGFIDKSIAASSEEDELRSQIYYGGISDPEEIRKIAKKKEGGKMKWAYQLKNNPHTPSDIIEKIYREESDYSDKMRLLDHPNFPMKTLLTLFTRDKYNLFWNRADTPKNLQETIYEAYAAPLPPGKKRGAYGATKPPKFELTEKQLSTLWAKTMKAHSEEAKDRQKEPVLNQYPTGAEYALQDWAESPYCPEKVLRQILDWENRKDKDGVVHFSISRAKAKAYKNLVSRQKITTKEIAQKVRETLNLDGEDSILEKFGERAFCAENKPNPIKRKITRVSDDEKKRLQAEMSKTAVHDDFDYEIVDAYEVDKEPHKDFAATEKRIGNVMRGVYHGTSFGNAAGILADGVNTHSKSRTGQMFGEGFYIASASSKAVQYASDNFSKDEGEGIVFVLDACLGKSSEMKYGRPRNDDLDRDYSEESDKMRKDYEQKTGYKTNTRWHLSYDSVTAKAGQSLDHDEYVVKDGSQIQIKRIIHVKKKPKVK